MTRVRMKPEDRKAQLLAAGVAIALKGGVKGVTRLSVAEATGTTDGLINRYFEGRTGLRSAVIDELVKAKKVAELAYAQDVEGFVLPAMPRQLTRDVKAYIAKQK